MILLVIDIQKGIADDDLYAFDTFKERTMALIDKCRKNNSNRQFRNRNNVFA